MLRGLDPYLSYRKGSFALYAPTEYIGENRIRFSQQTITVKVPRKPVRDGIDPYRLLDWEEREDDAMPKAAISGTTIPFASLSAILKEAGDNFKPVITASG